MTQTHHSGSNDNEHPEVLAVPRYHHAAPAPGRSPESNRSRHGA